MYGPIILTDTFISTGNPVDIKIASSCDWFNLYNYTRLAAGGAGTLAQAYWQRGMADGTGIGYIKTAVTDAMAPGAIAVNGGFTLYESFENTVRYGAIVDTITRINDVTVECVDTAGLNEGDMVQFSNCDDASSINGIIYTIDTINPGVSFDLSYSPDFVDTVTADGAFRKVNFYNPNVPYPRFISAITQAAQAVVTLTVTHSYQIGEKVRFSVEAIHGMHQLHRKIGTIVDTNDVTNTITVDINTTAMDAFAFPTDVDAVAYGAYTPAQVFPCGQTGSNQNVIAPFTNQALITIVLGTTLVGTAGDVIFWQAGKSFGM